MPQDTRVRRRRRVEWLTPTHTPHVATLLLAWRQGETSALKELIPLVHDELRQIARRGIAGDPKGHSLHAPALVNEAYLRRVDVQRVNWHNRAHFLAIPPRLMRCALCDKLWLRRELATEGSVAKPGLSPKPQVSR